MMSKYKMFVAAMAVSLAAGAAVGAAGPAMPEPIRDLEYAKVGDESLKLDIYLPADTSSPVPAILWVHGGGWRNGSKDKTLAQFMTGEGFAVVSINYRLGPKAKFPDYIEDCKAAVRWVRANAGKYHIDPARIGAWGSSAGGHLVALLGVTGDEKQFDKGGNLDQSSAVQAVCDWSGPADVLEMDRTIGKTSKIQHANLTMLVGEEPEKDTAKAVAASPVTYVTKAKTIPPFLIMHGDEDKSVPFAQGELMYEALKKAGADVQFHCVKGAGHGFAKFKKEVNPIVVKFFDEKLKKSPKSPATAKAN